MGARIAAHFANAGFPVDLLDIVLPNQPKRNAAALAGIETASKQRPTLIATIKTIFARKPPKPFTSGESSLPMCWRRKSPKLADMMMDARGCAGLHAFP